MRERGQSMVEMAIITPLLIFMFIGLIEVGWAIRGYLVILQISRELTRLSVRQDTAQFWPVGEAQTDEERIREDMAYQLLRDYYSKIGGPEAGTAIIHRYRAYTGRTCTTIPCPEDCAGDIYTADDERGNWLYQIGITRTSKINDESHLETLMSDNFLQNCQKQLRFLKACLNSAGETEESCMIKLGNVNTDFPSDSILIEVFYDQPQLTGFYYFLDPVPLWAYTTMRIP